MGGINSLLKRWGFVKLDQYGLALTPENRVISARPAVLDDGSGGRIVGWRDDDLAAMQLDRWGIGAASPPVSIVPRPAAPLRVVTIPPPVVARSVVPVVAEPPPVEEDEWEWEIAMARARAAAAEVEQAAASFVRPSVTKPMAAVAAPPAYENWDDSRTPRSVVKTVARAIVKPIVSPPILRRTSDTIIPVPKLPTVTDPRSVRPVGMTAVTPPRRFPKATAQMSDETVRTSPAPANQDATKPGIALPPSHASTSRRVAARQK